MDTPDIADLVEDSLRLLDEAGITDQQFRSAAAALYDFESGYVSQATYFRGMGTLLDHGYFAEVPIEEHPDWEEKAEAIGPEQAGSIEPIFREPDAEWDEDDNPIVAYLQDETMYVESGTELWERLVDAGAITDEAAEPLEPKTLYAAAADVCEMADEAGKQELILRWYVALGFHVGMDLEGDEDQLLADLQSDPDVGRLRRVVSGIDDLEMTLAHPKHKLDVPPRPLLDAHPILGWWYDLL